MDTFVCVVEVALCCKGEYLVIKRPLGKHAEGMLAFPGEKVDHADHVQGRDNHKPAAMREFYEEMGAELACDLHYVCAHSFVGGKGQHVVNCVFAAHVDENPGFKPSSREVPWYGWMNPAQIRSSPNVPVWMYGYLDQIALMNSKINAI